MRIFRKVSCCAVLLNSLLGLAHAAGDPARGSRVFGQCAACHSVAPGEHMTGPSLAKIWNKKAASAEGFSRYSEALKRADAVWNEATLDRWLVQPEKLVPGTSMTFPGLKEAKDRQDVIAYLRAVSEGKAHQAQQGGRAMMGMRREKLDLRKVPAEGQVTSITHCGDTYTIGTADGKNQKIWEFNLRFKTDSSRLGPLPGKPVAVGAGMQGDRASVVFASPKEISEFIKQSCP
ncbi:MAG: c-type cytochrome [Betaproteobacteria bacterium]|nr:MAG: c-type cytochrome [Betaproteobacteria bacterium]